MLFFIEIRLWRVKKDLFYFTENEVDISLMDKNNHMCYNNFKECDIMKKLITIILTIVCVFSFTGCEKTPIGTEVETETKTEISNKPVFCYIKEVHNKTMAFDEIEWVDVPGERATELNVTDEDAPNGYYIHNEENVITEIDIADDCEICILDWENSFTEKKIELTDFIDILDQRNGALIPYMLTIKDGKIINIKEHYIP